MFNSILVFWFDGGKNHSDQFGSSMVENIEMKSSTINRKIPSNISMEKTTENFSFNSSKRSSTIAFDFQYFLRSSGKSFSTILIFISMNNSYRSMKKEFEEILFTIRDKIEETFLKSKSSRFYSRIFSLNISMEKFNKEILQLNKFESISSNFFRWFFLSEFFLSFCKKTSSLIVFDQISDENDRQNQISVFSFLFLFKIKNRCWNRISCRFLIFIFSIYDENETNSSWNHFLSK